MELVQYAETCWNRVLAALALPADGLPKETGSNPSARIVVLPSNAADAAELRPPLLAAGVTFRARGKWLFPLHPWLRQFLLALLGLADDHDTVGELALLARPFFPLGLEDRILNVALGKQTPEQSRVRWEQGRAELAALRKKAHVLGPASGCIRLAERAGCGLSVGERELLWQLVDVLEQVSWQQSADLVGFGAQLLAWLMNPTDFARRLPHGEWSVEVVDVPELEQGETVGELLILPDGTPRTRLRWRVEGEGVVVVTSLQSGDERTVRVVRRLYVPEPPGGGGGSGARAVPQV